MRHELLLNLFNLQNTHTADSSLFSVLYPVLYQWTRSCFWKIVKLHRIQHELKMFVQPKVTITGFGRPHEIHCMIRIEIHIPWSSICGASPWKEIPLVATLPWYNKEVFRQVNAPVHVLVKVAKNNELQYELPLRDSYSYVTPLVDLGSRLMSCWIPSNLPLVVYI